MRRLRDYSGPLSQGAKIIMSDLEDGGVHTFGTVYWVDPTNGSDTNDGLTKETPFATIGAANTAVTSGNHDVVFLSANAAHAQTSMLTITKSRVHFIGLGMRGGSHGFGARARITMGSSTVAADIALMQNTGVGNTFTGIKFDSSSTEALSLWGVAEGGEYTIYRSCEFYKSSDLDVTLSAELLHNGDSTQYINCTFGSLANAISTAIIRPCVELAKNGVTASSVSRDGVFQDCLFWRLAGGTANAFVDATGVNDVERALMFRDCDFVAAELGSVPAEAVTSSGGKQERGIIALRNCTSWNCTLLCEASVGIHVSGPSVTFATAGVAKDA